MSLSQSKQQTNEDSHDKAQVRPFSSHRQASGDTGDLLEPIKSSESSPDTSLEESLISHSDQSLAYISCTSTTPTLTNNFRQTPCNQQNSSDTAEMSDSEASETNQTNLIVNYLPPYMSQDEVKALFSSVGEVESCKLVREKNTGESLGYAFVKFVKPSQARKAVDRLNGLRLQNKTIKVSLARPSSESIKGANLYICGLPKRMTQSEIETLFSRCGKIITARILYDNRTGISRGVAFIRFDQRHEAESAIKKLNGYRPVVEYPDAGPVEPIIVKFASSPTVLKQENLSMALLKQAVHGNALAKSFFANSFGGMKSSDFLMNQFLGPGLMTSHNSMNPQGWSLFVYNLAPETDESDLWQLFGPFGAVLSVKLSRDNWTHNCRGFAFITMTNYEEALLAVQSLNGVMLGDRLLQVSFKTHPGFKMRNLNLPPYYHQCMDDIMSSEMQQLSLNNHFMKKSNSSFAKHTPGSKSLLKNFSVAVEDSKCPGEEEKSSNSDN